MNLPVIFLGSNQHIILYKEICEAQNIPIAGIIDGDYFGNQQHIDGIPFIGSEIDADWDTLKQNYRFFIGCNPVPGIERNRSRRHMWVELVKKHNLNCVNIIDPQCRIGSTTTLGQGVYIGYCASINSHTQIGDHCQIHAHAGIGHHCQLEENVVVQRKAVLGGSIVVKKDAYVGIGVSILNKPNTTVPLTIGSQSIIHPTLLVMRDVDPNEVIQLVSRRVYEPTVIK